MKYAGNMQLVGENDVLVYTALAEIIPAECYCIKSPSLTLNKCEHQ